MNHKYVQLTSYNEQNNPYNVLFYYKGQLIDDEYSHVENGDKLFIENPRLIEKLSHHFERLFNNSIPNILEIQNYFGAIFLQRNICRKYIPSLCCWNNKGLWLLVSDCYNFDKREEEEERKEEERQRLEEEARLFGLGGHN